MNLIVIQGQLTLFRHFLEHVTEDACRELESIEERRIAGDIESFDELESLHDYPVARIMIASRAVACELNALVEGELHRLAHEPWLESQQHKGPKNILQLDEVTPEHLKTMRQVSDLRFPDILKLLQEHHGLRLDGIGGWAEVQHLRDAVNAFKHRQGYKHPRESDWTMERTIPQQYHIYRYEADQAIRDVGSFLRNLKTALDMAHDVPSEP